MAYTLTRVNPNSNLSLIQPTCMLRSIQYLKSIPNTVSLFFPVCCNNRLHCVRWKIVHYQSNLFHVRKASFNFTKKSSKFDSTLRFSNLIEVFSSQWLNPTKYICRAASLIFIVNFSLTSPLARKWTSFIWINWSGFSPTQITASVDHTVAHKYQAQLLSFLHTQHRALVSTTFPVAMV